MIFEVGRYYRHRTMIDVIFKVRQVGQQDPESVLNVIWYNLRVGFPLGDVDMIVIKTEDKPDYRRVVPAWVTC